ncbi:MAG TPA: M56 family metallopeptidase [Frateuria sp.]|uniref:M56 family metallopeptidase n=1 Tax=Frateuria sp. TaxID=2211372 RepID=UPI002DF41AC6|nr:M56 family metallopeptidase [Frateuria sp.]
MNFFTAAYLARLGLWGLLALGLQGALVALSWLAWERTAAGATAASRHRLACLHFAALLTLPLLALVILHATVATMGVPPPRGSPVAGLAAQMAGYRTVLWLALALAAAWLAGVAAMLLRLAKDAGHAARLRCGPAPAAWVAAVDRLASARVRALRLRVLVAEVASPQVSGLWRPVLLLPPDFATRLGADERDAVLLHELAHLERGDFGWNLLQRLVLALLWFHPVAWMLYRCVSRERELCCDALAVRHGASAAGLARALVCLAESPARPAAGLPVAAQGNLAERVHGLLGSRRRDMPSLRRRAAAAVLSACCLLALGAARLGQADPALADLCHASAFGSTLWVYAHDGAGSFALQIRHGRVIGASVERQPLPPERIRQQGSRVALLDAERTTILALTVTPQDRIEWTARR